MEKKKEKSTFSKLVKDLNASQEVIVLDALEKVKTKGEPKIIPHLAQVLKQTQSQEVVRKITELLFSIKDEDAIPYLIESMKDQELQEEHRSIFIGSFWNSGLNPAYHIDEFVAVAINGSYLECMEAFTVIENLEPPFDEDQLMNALVDIRQHINEHKNDEKAELLNSILMVLTVFNDR